MFVHLRLLPRLRVADLDYGIVREIGGTVGRSFDSALARLAQDRREAL
jgi:hypothetical protein